MDGNFIEKKFSRLFLYIKIIFTTFFGAFSAHRYAFVIVLFYIEIQMETKKKSWKNRFTVVVVVIVVVVVVIIVILHIPATLLWWNGGF